MDVQSLSATVLAEVHWSAACFAIPSLLLTPLHHKHMMNMGAVAVVGYLDMEAVYSLEILL